MTSNFYTSANLPCDY